MADAKLTGAAARILVTGAAGFVGRHLVRSLKSALPAAGLFAGLRGAEQAPDGTTGLRFDIADAGGADAAIREMHDYFGQMAQRLRRHPDGGIVARMVAAEEKGDFLSEDELVAACVLLLFAGHETTTQLFGNGLYALLRWPEQMQRLRDGLHDRGQVEKAVEEILRWDGPGLAGVRVLNEDVDLHGQRVPAGSRIFQFVAAANRDPAVFADP